MKKQTKNPEQNNPVSSNTDVARHRKGLNFKLVVVAAVFTTFIPLVPEFKHSSLKVKYS